MDGFRLDRGAWEDVVLEGDDVDLTKLPVPLQFKVDAAPYITAGQIVARDPVTGVDTTGFHRLMLKDKNRLGVSLHSRRRLYEFHRRAEERGKPLPATGQARGPLLAPFGPGRRTPSVPAHGRARPPPVAAVGPGWARSIPALACCSSP